MNYISSDAIIKNAKHNLVLQNFNYELQNKLNSDKRDRSDPRSQSTWFDEVNKESFIIPGLENNIDVEEDISQFSQEKDKIAPEAIVKMKSQSCPCGSLESRDNYTCYCNTAVEKTETGKPIEPFTINKPTTPDSKVTISFDKADLYIVVIIILVLLLICAGYGLYISNMKCVKLKLKYKKMKHKLNGNNN